MDYVALKWSTIAWCDDRGFLSALARLRERGWEEHLRAHFEKYEGGACIMRRPKDEPQEAAQRFEYLLLDDQVSPKRMAAKRRELDGFGWKEWRAIPWSGMRMGSIQVYRRSKERGPAPKDEPRMWTNAEIEEIAKRYYWRRAKKETNG